MKLIDTHVEHINFVKELRHNDESVDIEYLKAVINSKTDKDIIKSFIDDGVLIGIGVVKYMWNDCAELAFFNTGTLESKHVRFIAKSFKKYTAHITRIQTHTVSGDFIKWHKLMGLKLEGTLKSYKDFKDYDIWARII
jgi:arginine deiminase